MDSQAIDWVPLYQLLLYGIAAFTLLLTLLIAIASANLGALWIQAYMSNADVRIKSLIMISLLRIDPRMIVTAKIMGQQAGLKIDHQRGMSTDRLIALHLAGGNVMNVVRAMIAAHRAGIDLEFDRAAAIDLAGRDVLLAVQTSVSPVVIACPQQIDGRRKLLSAVAKNGVELLVSAKVTVRTDLERLIGGATEDTIVARVGQEIITTIGSADSHMDVLETPANISKGAMLRGLDTNTIFSIVSIDISDIDVGENIGARLQTDQAEADTSIARAAAEARRALAVAQQQQMIALISAARAEVVLAEASIPPALADAIRAGRIHPRPSKAL